MKGRFRLPGVALLSILFLAACGDPPSPVGIQDPEREEQEEQEEEQQQPVRDYASTTPVGALAGFLDLGSGGPGTEAAVDVFLKIPDIPGESEDAHHEDEIEVFGIEWILEVEVGPGDDGEVGAMARLGEIVLTKGVDLASHELAHVLQQGTAIAEMDLAVRRSHAEGDDYFQIELTDVLVSSIQPGSSTPGAAADTEEVRFVFKNITWTLSGAEPETGSASPAIPLDGLVAFLELDVPSPDPQPQRADMYLKLPDIEGESEAAGHEGHIDIESFSWPTRVHVDAQAGTGGVDLQDIVLTKPEDSTSRVLADAAAAGTVFDEIVLHIRKDGGGTAEPKYHNLTLKRGFISSHTPGSSADEVPTETLSLNYEEIGG